MEFYFNYFFRNPISISLNFIGWIKLIFDPVDFCTFVINDFNLSFEVQESGALQNALFSKLDFSKRVLQLPLGYISKELVLNIKTPHCKSSSRNLSGFYSCPSAICTPVVPITSDDCIQNSYKTLMSDIRIQHSYLNIYVEFI